MPVPPASPGRAPPRNGRRRVGAAALLATACVCSCRAGPRGSAGDAAGDAPRARPQGRLVILAMDGIDPDWLDTWTNEGRLPGFARLRERGTYHWLRTTQPPSCEAAWTAFVTGLAPADSGVFGPLRRDPATRLPAPGAVDVDLAAIPPRISSRRSGTAFWRLLDDAGVRARVLWAPYEISLEPLAVGEVLAGAGVPDISGRESHLMLGAAFPDAPGEAAGLERGRLVPSADGWTAELPGPPSPRKGAGRLNASLVFRRHADGERLAMAIGDAPATAAAGAWSGRVPVRFAGGGVEAGGLARFLALDAGPSPVVLIPPLEIDPARPWLQVSYPPSYVVDLAVRYGRVPTTGSPGLSGALSAGWIAQNAFLADLLEDFDARSRIILAEFERGGFDLFIAFVPTAGPLTRGLYRQADPSVPGHDPAAAASTAPGFGGVRLRDAVLAGYAFIDDLVGRLAGLPAPGDELIILSNHGFQPYRRAVHLNAWLRREGFLVVRRDAGADAARRPPGPADVDWTRTRAYAVGHGAIYANLAGREPGGIVEPDERLEMLLARLAERLDAWRDAGAGGARVVRRALVRGRDFAGRRDEALPDVMVLFEPGYRTSDETAAGLVPAEPIEDNRSVTGADSVASDAGGAEGFLFSTRPVFRGDPAIADIGATALRFFGVEAPAGRGGRDLWSP